MMEKNGNTVSQGDKVTSQRFGVKTATTGPADVGEVKTVDIENEQALVKWASGREEYVRLADLQRLP